MNPLCQCKSMHHGEGVQHQNEGAQANVNTLKDSSVPGKRSVIMSHSLFTQPDRGFGPTTLLGATEEIVVPRLIPGDHLITRATRLAVRAPAQNIPILQKFDCSILGSNSITKCDQTKGRLCGRHLICNHSCSMFMKSFQFP